MEPGITLNYIEFRQKPMRFFVEELPVLFKAMGAVINYPWSNSHYYVTNLYGEAFEFLVFAQPAKKTNEFDFSIDFWNHTGGDALAHIHFTGTLDDTIPAKPYEAFLKTSERYTHGFCTCSDCGQEFKRFEEYGRVFAGRYCDACYLGKTGRHADRGGWKRVQDARGFYD